MLEETAQDAADVDSLGQPLDPRTQRADGAHDQVDPHPLARGLVEGPDDLPVGQAVHLRLDPRRTAGPGMLDLPLDHALDFLDERARGDQEPAKPLLGRAGGAGELVEEVVEIGAEVRIRRHEAQIRVEAGRGRVVVARADVHVTPHAPALPAHDERGLGVCLVADDPVHDPRPRRLEAMRPVDVALLVEARLELDEHRHLLAGGKRLEQRVHHGRAPPGAVQGQLDRHHLGVRSRLAEEPPHRRVEVLIGVVTEDVALGEDVEDRPVRVERLIRLVRGIARRVDGTVAQLGDAAQVHRTVDLVDVGPGQRRGLGRLVAADAAQEVRADLARHARFDLEPDDRLVRTVLDLVRHRREQRARVVLVDLEGPHAARAEDVRVLDPRRGEELARARADDLLDRDEVRGVRDREEPLDVPRNRQVAQLPAVVLPPAQHDGQGQPQADQVREGPARARREREGREQRKDLLGKALLEADLLVLLELFPAQDPGPPLRQRRKELLPEQGILAGDERAHAHRHEVEELLGRQTLLGVPHPSARDLVLEAAHPHDEELVGVAGEDRQEAEALEERHLAILRHLQNPLVEVQDAQLEVQVVVGSLARLDRLLPRPEREEPWRRPALRRLPQEPEADLGPHEHEHGRDQLRRPQPGAAEALHELHERNPDQAGRLRPADALVQPHLQVLPAPPGRRKPNEVDLCARCAPAAAELDEELAGELVAGAARHGQGQGRTRFDQGNLPIPQHQQGQASVVGNLRARSRVVPDEGPADPLAGVQPVADDPVLVPQPGAERVQRGRTATELRDRHFLKGPRDPRSMGDDLVERDAVGGPTEEAALEIPGLPVEVQGRAGSERVGLDHRPHPGGHVGGLGQRRVQPTAHDGGLEGRLAHDPLQAHLLADQQLHDPGSPRFGADAKRHTASAQRPVDRVEVRVAGQEIRGLAGPHAQRAPPRRELAEQVVGRDRYVQAADHGAPAP